MSHSFPNWQHMSNSEHFVQFYHKENSLMNSLINYIGKGIIGGHSCVVIATKQHRNILENHLQKIGLHITTLKSKNKFISLDAEETLAQFMFNDKPDLLLFKTVIGDIIKKVENPPFDIRAFGEMVAILWAQGNKMAAIQLEQMWNDLARIYSFSLFCAYPRPILEKDDHTDLFKHVCSAHTSIISDTVDTITIDDQKQLREISSLHKNALLLKKA